jgi:transposase
MLNMESTFADISDELWDRVQWLLPTPPVRRNHKGGRPPTPDRVVLSGILYRLRTGCQWEAIEYRKIKRPFPPTPARGEPTRPAPAAGQPWRQPAGHRPAPQGTDRTGGW